MQMGFLLCAKSVLREEVKGGEQIIQITLRNTSLKIKIDKKREDISTIWRIKRSLIDIVKNGEKNIPTK